MAINLYMENSHKNKYVQLTKGNNRAFSTFKSVYLTSALIAIKTGLGPKKISSKHDFLKDGQLSSSDHLVIKYIALSQSEDVKILANKQATISLVDELANAGIGELSRILSHGSENLFILQEFCDDHFWKDE
jgi:hypothetical protein